MRSILVVAGVTAAGKTAAAIELARRFDGELVGADSVQVYRGFDIGSAKPAPAELGGLQHHLLDVVDPDEPIDAADYARRADGAIATISSKGRLPIVVGGTGLWLRALLRGLVELPPPDPDLRARLEAEAAALDPEALHARLAAIDPALAPRLHPRDKVRIVRALEVHAQTGRPLGELQREHALGAPRYRAFVAVLDRPRTELHDAIRARIASMLASGWVEETRALLERWGPDVRPMGAVGYREIRDHLQLGIPLEETARLAYKSTRTYARRQRTWMRGHHAGAWHTTAAELISGAARIEAFLEAAGRDDPG